MTLAAENGHPDIKNTIGIALVERILKAHREGKKFRVIVVMPLMPAFEADIMSTEAGTLRKVMHFQYVSICRGGNSLLERLVAEGVDPDQYIGFFGLRSFDRIKHGKFDAIVEAVREAEQQRQQQQQRKSGESQTAQTGQEQNANTATPEESGKDTQTASPSKSRSLAAKYLLDPIPKGEEAARIMAIADNRKKLDESKPWDESITKRAMNPAIREIGYIPATTEMSLADEELNDQIQRATLEAEMGSGRQTRRRSESTDAESLNELGTEPVAEKASKNQFKVRNARHTRLFGKDDAGIGGSNSIDRDDIVVSHGYETTLEQAKDDKARLDQAKKMSEQEAILEPMDQPTSGDDSEEATADPAKFPNADKPGPVKVEKPVIDNEVDDFVTEQLYIHSKLMIVDDRIIICGSGKHPNWETGRW